MSKFIKMATVIATAWPLFWSGGASALALPGITPDPNFENYVTIKYQRADNQSNKLTAEAKKITGEFFTLDGTKYTVDNLSYKLRANFTNDKSPTLIDGTVRINGSIPSLGAQGVLLTADLNTFVTDGDIIHFGTTLTSCASAFLSECLSDDGEFRTEAVWLFDFGGGFDVKHKKFRADGTAITTIPVPAAVWLFGSGLLGLVSLAKRKKAAA